MYLLTPAEQGYAWGSRSAIQSFAGFGSPDQPLAEIWYGAHPSGQTRIHDGGTLESLLRDHPEMLGDDVRERFRGRLPYLVKLIAPGQAVSLQVHPEAQRARDGYTSQQNDPMRERRFVDDSHKPEQILALTTFEGLVGMRPVEESRALLAPIAHPLARAAGEALARGDDRAVREAIVILAAASADDVDAMVEAARGLGELPHIATMLELAAHYPGDPGLLISLLLRRIRLEPGESVLVHSGVPHAYMSGLAVEVMANSDNVFRLGLTAKRVDIEESLANLSTAPAAVSRPHGVLPILGPDEFQLDVTELTAEPVELPGAGPRIALAMTHGCTLMDERSVVQLPRGHAAFLPAGDRGVTAVGPGRVAAVSVPMVSVERRHG